MFETANERWRHWLAAEEEEVAVGKQDSGLATVVQSIVDKTFSFYMCAHVCHWNTAGSDFPEFHDFFGEIYEDAIGAIDHLAELVLMLGSKAALSPETPDCGSSLQQMLASLSECNDKLVSMLKDGVERATEAGEHAVANDLADRLGAHQKWAWQLSATKGNDGI